MIHMLMISVSDCELPKSSCFLCSIDHSHLIFLDFFSFDSTISNTPALIELPFAIQTNKFVQPVNLPTDCGTDLDHEKVVAAGNGQRSFNYDTGMDTKLRHVYLQALQNDVCVENTNENIPPGSLICALPNKGQSIGQGDSGEQSKNLILHL